MNVTEAPLTGLIIFVDYPHDWILRQVLEYVVNRPLAFEHNDP
jgi:hypothetical protein